MGILSRLLAASPENPRFSLNDPAAWDALAEGDPASSGMHVGREQALTCSPWWRGINLLAGDVAKLPLHLYRRQGEGKERAVEHPAYYLLRRKPNPYQTAFQFRRQLTGHAISCGNGYAYISRRGDGAPLELLPLDPHCTHPVREDGRLLYVTSVGTSQSKLLGENVLHIKGYGYDGLCGYSVVDKARESLGLSLAARKYSAVFFKNSGRPPVTITAPGKMDNEARKNLREGWERMHSGIDNAHRTAILDMGLKAEVLAFNAEDSQLIQSREFEIREIANFIGVPPHKIGDTTRTGYASLEQENQSYLDESLDTWLVNWEEECWDKLLTESEKMDDTHIVEFLRAALVRADLTTRGNYYSTALGGRPWMTQNEVRGRENLNPLPNPEADQVLEPLNMAAPAEEPPEPEPAEDPEEEPAEGGMDEAALRAAHRGLLGEVVGRMVRRVALHAERAAKEPRGFMTWVDGLEERHRSVVQLALAPVQATLAAAGWPLQPGAIGDWLLAALRREYTDVASRVTARDLAGEVAIISAGLDGRLAAEAVAMFLGDKP